MTTLPPVSQRVRELVDPGILLVSSACYFTTVLLETVICRGELLAPVLRLPQIKDEAFSRFWIKFSGSRDTSDGSTPVEPTGSSALIPPLLSKADGLVLDIGPGTGTQTPLFTNPGLRKMYGAEPCLGLHADLRSKIESCGLSSKYEIMHCGAQPKSLIPGLHKAGLLDDGDDNEGQGQGRADLSQGIFDTVVCVRVLCSVPDPEETIKGLYDLVKPGGKMLVCEHVVNPWMTGKGSVIARFVQVVCELVGWRFFMGSCHLNRDTGAMLRRVAAGDGGWESVDLESSFNWSPLPYVSGTLVKKA